MIENICKLLKSLVFCYITKKKQIKLLYINFMKNIDINVEFKFQ